MKDRLVTVFGGGGFIGRYVVQALLARGARVRVAERDPRRAYFLRPLGGLGQTQFIAADVTRPATVAAAVAHADAVVNLVGTFGGSMVRTHVDGARHVAEAAAAAGAGALVHLSAIGADPASRSAYGRTKGQGERAVAAAFPRATIVRPSVVFGREDQFTNRFANMIAKAPIVPVLRAPARFQPVFAADVGEAVAAALADPAAHGGRTYELGGPDVLSMGQIIHWLADTIGRRPRIVDLPDVLGGVIARLPGGPLTVDQWLMLQQDSVAAPGAPGLEALDIRPTPLAAVAPDWLVRFRRKGRFARRVEDLAA